ncbi:non-hydrolyzing UDP-N-acetylglucosamine 2-epimerase [Notoacmeibacter sp. MSK16QG-6]|uniref:non-hydrolyzing UDP-N-acetylglucosamine 2-epimerase n=1 Tax=Notoacmeibacter sp. MSK16QG-6 TaxID=2957982 RepID=UPI0020A0416A|nr:UDP-N-acetylglucosamine 2-epimerase (non-hydrolyzing) [Notoacmeibacter sp. MSK16QG-6]MCP1198060.1 UDP-N-acetylglucosamine 2-epimerase (non-hydrolyzing) [Notoacmeibacter sp. MSK16QG-6]
MKLVTIIGARPQFIKAATVSRVVADRAEIREMIVHTGQHYDANMSDVFFEELAIPKPDYNLGVGGGMHGSMTGRQLEAIERVLLDEKPDWVLVYGDTNSTLAGALAAVKLHIPVAHVEAGLRSFNRRMPEEINRVLTDHAADLLFAPTDTAVGNLKTEGLPIERIELSGDVMYDAALFYRHRARQPGWFAKLGLKIGDFVLATIHRAENTDNPARLAGIIDGLANSEEPVVLPLHPRTRARLYDFGIKTPGNIHIVPPVGYLEMVWLEVACKVIASDSGGLQKEAYFHNRRCIILRDETEWVELVDAGYNLIAGADSARIVSALSKPLSDVDGAPLYGTGVAADLIIERLIS